MEPTQFLDQYGKSLSGFEFNYGIDNNQMKPHQFASARKRVLFAMASTGATRSVSNTYTIIDNLVRQTYGDEIFIDYCYLPERDDIDVYAKTRQGFLFGNVSHRPWTEYDCIFISLAILQELWNVPYLLKQNSIPLNFKDRMADDNIPLIVTGGVSSTMADIIFGELEEGSGDGCLTDLVYVGHMEPGMEDLMQYILDNDVRKDKRKHVHALANESSYILAPYHYDFKWHNDKDNGFIIDDITANDVPETVFMAHMDHMNYPGFERKILNVNGEAATAGDLDISSGCSGGGQCVFCYEGVVGGKWMERPLDKIVDRMKTLRTSSAPNTIGFYSYNLNYYGGFIDLLNEAAKRFSNLSLINMRADVIGAEPRYMDISILLGLRRASLPVEGIGDRIRNNFLNKNLSFEQWMAAARVIFKTRMAECKHGMIYCIFPDEKIATIDGYKKAADVQLGDKVFNGHRWVDVQNVVENEPTPCYEVTTSTGLQLKCTHDHPFLMHGTQNEFTKASELQPGDFIAIPEVAYQSQAVAYSQVITKRIAHIESVGSNSTETTLLHDIQLIDENIAFLTGAYAGSGINGDARVLFHPNSKINNLFHERIIDAVEVSKIPSSSRLLNGLLEVESIDLTILMEAIFGEDANDQLRIPEVIMSSPLSVQQAFLSGVAASIGHYQYSKTGNISRRWCTLTHPGKKFLQDAQLLLQTMGIQAKIKNSEEFGMFDLFIRVPDQPKFWDMIGMCTNLTEDELEIMEEQPIAETNPVSITSVKYIGNHVTIGHTVDTHQHVTNGMITHNTGYETEDDFNESLEEFQAALDLRNELGANTAMRCTFTPLVYYPHTPLQRLTRTTSIQVLLGQKKMTNYLRELNSMGIRTKVNGRSKSTFMEQFVLDFGRLGTKHLVAAAGDRPPYYGTIPKNIEDKLLSSLHRDGHNPISFMMKKPEDHRLWCQPVEALNPDYLSRWVQRAEAKPNIGFKSRQCTVSPANLKSRSEEAMKTELVATCSSCGDCGSTEEVNSVVQREVVSASGFAQVMMSINNSRPKYMTLVGVDIKPEHFMVSAKMLSHKITGLLMSTDADFNEPKFFQVGKTSLNWVVENYQRDWMSGRFVYPILWNDKPVFPENALEMVNAELDSCQVFHIGEATIPDKRFIKLTDATLWKITSTSFNSTMFRTNFTNFDNKVPVAKKAMSPELVLEEHEFDLLPPIVDDLSDGGSVIYVALPMQVNPYLYIGKLFGWNFAKAIQSVNVQSLYTLRETHALCGTCNNHVYEDILGRIKLKQCPSCMSKIILSRSKESSTSAVA